MLQSAPNIDYLKAAWAALGGISGANAKQSYEAAGLSFTRVNHSTLVRKNDIQVSTMPVHYTRQELRVGFLGRIENEVRKMVGQMEPILLRDLELPAGYRLVIELEECLRLLRRKGNRSLSILVIPEDDAMFAATLRVEMRVFLDSPRACMFACVTHGSLPEPVDLLATAPKRVRVPRASSYRELAEQMSTAINAALSLTYTGPLAA